MSPSCTGDPKSTGRWVCPYCVPISKPIDCYTTAVTPDGDINVPCKKACPHAGFRASNPAEYWKHVMEEHNWDGSVGNEPVRRLDYFQAPSPKTKLPAQRGPSKAARAKAKAKRKRKKKR